MELTSIARRYLSNKIEQLTEGLEGNFSGRHAFLAREHLDRLDSPTETIARLSAWIESVMPTHAESAALLTTRPGVSTTLAEIIIAETGGEMIQFRPRLSWRLRPESARAATNLPERSSPRTPVQATTI